MAGREAAAKLMNEVEAAGFGAGLGAGRVGGARTVLSPALKIQARFVDGKKLLQSSATTVRLSDASNAHQRGLNFIVS